MKQNTDTGEKSRLLYRQAEDSLINQDMICRRPALDHSVQLIHELRMSMAALELQSKELNCLKHELLKSNKRYAELYNFVPESCVTLSKDGLILEANRAASFLLGGDQIKLTGRHFSEFILKEDRHTYDLNRKKNFETGEPLEYELRILNHAGVQFRARLTAVQYGSRCRTIVGNISEQKQVSDTLALLAGYCPPNRGNDFFKTLARCTAENLGMNFVCIGRLEKDGSVVCSEAVWMDGKFEDNMIYEIKDTPCGEKVSKAVCCFPSGVSKLFPRDRMLQSLRAESYSGVTLFGHSGRPIGQITAIGRSPLKKRQLTEEMLKIISVHAAGEMERMDQMESLRISCIELQKTISQLASEKEKRVQAEKSLREALSDVKLLKDQLEVDSMYLRQKSHMKHQHGKIIGNSEGLMYVLYRAEQVAPTNTTVLILGETGTGKELIAGAVHNMSPRKDRPMITVNCAALPANLMESELFGREKGAFTGADTRQIGRFEIANGSTLCLDEIGELPLEMQAKLLRAIQHSEFERLGSSRTIKVDVRIIATTNRNLEEAVRKGWFRQDLYYRINVFSITVPPLRQRQADIPLMVESFIKRYAKKLGKQITSIDKTTMKKLQDYTWPGNVRELESVIEKAAILSPGPVLQLTDKLETAASPSSSTSSNGKTLEEAERNQILKILSETRWRIEGKNGAAGTLGIHPSTLRARMHKLSIRRPGT